MNKKRIAFFATVLFLITSLVYAIDYINPGGFHFKNEVTVTAPPADDNDTSAATTAFVQQEINGAGGTDLSCSGGQCNVGNPVTAATTASNLAVDGVDALTEIAQGIKTANDDTSALVVGTAGSNGEIAKWNTDGTLTDNNVILGTMTDGKWCSYTAAGTLLSCTQNTPGAPATADISDVNVTQTELAELETMGVTTISANQWITLGSIAETLTGTELTLLDGITVLSGSNTGDDSGTDDQTAAEVSIADAGSIITATDVEGALQENRTAVDLNTAKTTESTTVTTPITLTGVSVGIVNQGATTQVLHGNAAGNAAFGAVVTADITNSNVTYAKIQNVSGTDKILGRSTAGAGIVEEIVCTSAGRDLIDDADASTQRTTLGVDAAGTDNSTNVTLNANATTAGLSLVTQEINYRAATNAQTGYMTAALVTNIETNNAKNTNVSTALSAGTVNATTYGITSDGGADDIVLPEADATNAGLLGSDKWDEIVANSLKTTNATHTGEVTGATALTIDPTSISGKADTTIADADFVLFWDATDSALKKVDAAELTAGGSAETLAVTLAAGADANDVSITSLNKLEGVDAQVYIGLGTDGKVILEADTGVEITSPTEITGLLTLTGGQIAFPATAVPSANANTLDDYEEGTWTPDLQFGGAKVGITYGVQLGSYTKTGRVISATCFIELTSKGTSTGVATVRGLPFTVKNNYGAVGACAYAPTNITFADMFTGQPLVANTYISLTECTNAGTVSNITNADFANNSGLYITTVHTE